jgi:Terminase large subunit gpA, endonuclease domain
MALDPRTLRPADVVRLINSTPLGEVLSERQLHRHRERAGMRIGDDKHIDLIRYGAWLADQRHNPKPKAEAQDYETKKEKAAQREREKSERGREIGPIPEVVNPERRAEALASLQTYCETYKRERFYLAWSDDQLAVIAILEQCAREGGLFAVAMMRGGGKTELCKATIEWVILSGLHSFAMLIAATDKLAKRILRDIKRTLATNPLLLEDFPEVCYPLKKLGNINHRAAGQTVNGEPTNIIWTDDEIRLPTIRNSLASGSMIQTVGLTGAFRGANEGDDKGGSMRPTFVLGDDLQTRSSAGSVTQTGDRSDTIMGDILGLVGPTDALSMVMPCTPIYPGDLACQFTDRNRHPEWQGIRMKMIYEFPKNMQKWREYEDLKNETLRRAGSKEARKVCNDFYIENRLEMDEGSRIGWEGRVTKGSVSAIQTAMDLYLRDPHNFMAEYNTDPEEDMQLVELKQLTEEDLAKKLNTLPRRVVPRNCNLLTAFVDVQQEILYWVVCAWDEKFGGAPIDYGTFPEQPHDNFRAADPPRKLSHMFPGKAAIYQGLNAFIPNMLAQSYQIEGSDLRLPMRLCLIDARYETQQVHDFISRSPLKTLLHASMGRGIKAGDRPMSEYTKQPGDRVGLNWIIELKNRAKGLYASFDANFWKSFVVNGLLAPPGVPASIYLFGDKIYQHRMLVQHLLSEYRVSTAGRGRKLEEWKNRPGQTENHFLDGCVGAAVAASIAGLQWSSATAAGMPVIQEPKPVIDHRAAYEEQRRKFEARRAARGSGRF